MASLTAKQQRFVDEYLVDLNATQATIRAGYSKKTARAMGCENLTKPNIASAISDAQKERRIRLSITVDSVSRMLIADRDLARDLNHPSAAMQATMGLAKLHGLLVDRVKDEGDTVKWIISDKPMSEEEFEREFVEATVEVSGTAPVAGIDASEA